ncbi:cyclase [Micromonospora wenchangensis]|uniref:Cyclase n=1 Tax=Micromonospora wenchangensis TaxID=1185415 RepID=A0A246RS47_9ACTN|nr:cyclase family protein [Micromonospora wenchangensis]OWV11940.1 cyclase [Micromonospora wenchangensis]
MRIIDLSAPVDAAGWEPEPLTLTTMSAADGAKHLAAEMREHFGMEIDPADLPDGEFLTNDTVSLTTHTGTHIDAPAHYGSRAAYGRPRTIDELPVDWFHRPGVVLDLTSAPVGAVDADFIRDALARVDYRPAPMDIVLLHTGADRLAGSQRYFTDFVGLDASAVHHLLDLGVRVIGTDAFSLDAPFTHIIERYQRTRNRADLWPAHMAGRQREFCQIERLANLDALPRPHGFTVSCPPVKVAGAGAGWARAIALVPGEAD